MMHTFFGFGILICFAIINFTSDEKDSRISSLLLALLLSFTIGARINNDAVYHREDAVIVYKKILDDECYVEFYDKNWKVKPKDFIKIQEGKRYRMWVNSNINEIWDIGEEVK